MKAVVRRIFMCSDEDGTCLLPGDVVSNVHYDIDGENSVVCFIFDGEIYLEYVEDIALSTHSNFTGLDTIVIKCTSSKRWAVTFPTSGDIETIAVFHHNTRKKAREDKKRLQEKYDIHPSKLRILDLGK